MTASLLAVLFAVAPDASACISLNSAALGGPTPPAHTAVLRWFGTTNFELDYGDQVVLLDTFYDRGPRFRPIGFTVAEVKRADAILIGHAHWDHLSDVAPVARQTGAKVIGAPVTIEEAVKLGVPAAQTQVVRGGEIPGLFLDIGTEPLFMAIRDQLPGTRARAPLYREPVCLEVGAGR